MRRILSFMRSAPYVLGFRRTDQRFAEIGMGNGNESFCPLPRRPAFQFCYPVFRYDTRSYGPYRRNDIAM